MNAARVVDRPDPFVVPQALNRLRRSGFALSVEGGKLIVAPGSRLTDADRTFLRAHKPALVALLEDPPASPAPVIDWEAFEERAAIMEYDGGLTREEAERKALAALGLTASPASPTPDASANLNRPSLAPPIADPDMEAKLVAELPGILAWSIRGCLAWQRDGLGIPQAVRVATEAYRADMDALAAWMSECCVTGKRCEAKAADLYSSYTRWCESNGETPEAQRKWGMRLTERGFIRQKRMIGHCWIGIGLLETTHHDPYDPYDPEMTSFEPNVQTSPKNDDSGSYGSYGSYPPPKPPEKPPLSSVEAPESGLEPGLSSVTRDIEVFD